MSDFFEWVLAIVLMLALIAFVMAILLWLPETKERIKPPQPYRDAYSECIKFKGKEYCRPI